MESNKGICLNSMATYCPSSLSDRHNIIIKKYVGTMPDHHLRCWAGIKPTSHTAHSVGPIVIQYVLAYHIRWHNAGPSSTDAGPASSQLIK